MELVVNQDAATNEIGDGYADLTALTTGCGLYRAERALFSITGRDRVRWLNGMVSNNIRDLAAGHGVYAFVLNPQAHILGDLYVFNRGEGLIAEIEREQAQSLMQILRRYIIMDKVEIEDHSDKLAILGVIGPKSAEALANIGLNADLKSLECRDANWNNSPVTLVRNDNPYFPSFELWVPRDVQDSLRDALARAECEEVSQETLEIFRIFCGFPKFGQDIREKILPQETGQERALNFAKGCYIGQEIVERIRARGSVHRTFIGFEMEGIVPAGTKIQNDGKDVGEITSAINKQLRGKWLALGYLRKEFLDRQLTAAGTAVKPVTLPLTKIFS